MSFSLSQGPFSYNRFNEASKPDYLDFDKDRNKKESMTKALKDKEKEKSSGGCDCKEKTGKECECGKKEKKEQFVIVARELIDEGYDLSGYTWDGLYQEYISENREMAYGGGKSGKGSGDGSKPKGITGGKTYTMKGKDGKPLFKESVTKDDVLEFMLENSLANNVVSAEVLFNHISDEFLESIEEDIMEAYQQMSPKATAMSKKRSGNLSDQENAAARSGNEKKTNDLMQKKIKVMDARGNHGAR